MKKMLVDSGIMTAVLYDYYGHGTPFGWVITAEQIPVKIAEAFSLLPE
jgi:TRAP-type C4-dicarboxylate transport system permease large subunit